MASNDTIPTHVSHLSAVERTPPRDFSRGASVRPFPTVSTDRGAPNAAPRKFVAKGHDAQLQDAQFGKIPVRITLISGSTVKGLVTKRDKFTITVNHATGDFAGCEEILYKHAIEGVMLLRNESQAA